MTAVEVRKPWTIPDSQCKAILDALDEGTIGGGAGLDIEKRAPFRKGHLTFTVHHAAGGTATFSVFARNLGARGMSILHAGFLHERTSCAISLPTNWNTSEIVSATVARCRHVSGFTHELELAFTDSIDISRYAEPGLALTRLMTQEMDKSTIRGRVLHIDDQQIECELIKFHLRATNIEVTSVTRPGEAMDLIKTHRFDLVLCDLHLGDESGEDVIRQLRSLGCTSPMLIVTGDTNPAHLAKATEAGASGILSKPVDPQQLYTTAVEWLVNSANANDTVNEPIFSTLAESPDAEELIRQFLDFVARLMTGLQRAVDSDDVEEVRGICLDLKESGGTAGFAALSDAAVSSMKALDASCSVTESARQLAELRTLVSRLRPGPVR